MKKDKDNMITNFKLFETLSTKGLKPSYLMTLSEYKEKVSPILKDFLKYMKKNTLQYYIIDNYSCLNYITYPVYKEKELESFRRNKWNLGEDYVKKHWLERNGVLPETNIPENISKIVNEYLDFFTKVFGEKNLSKIEFDETKGNKRSLRRAIEDDTYLNMLKNNEITVEKLTEIFDSVGVKVPVGILKRANVKPIVKTEEKTDEQIQKIFNGILKNLQNFKDKNVNSYSLITRMKRDSFGISYATVYQFKHIVDNWKFLSDDQKSIIEKEFPDYSNKIKQFASKEEEKVKIENISFDKVLAPIIQKFKDGIQGIVDKQKKKIDEYYRSTYMSILDDYKTLTGTEFEKKHGYPVIDKYTRDVKGYSLNKFWNSTFGQLLKMKNGVEKELDKIITKDQDEYQMREYDKIYSLFGRLRTKYPNLVDFELETPRKGKNGVEFTMKAYDPKGVIYNIYTETITAGGYNIQRYHFRWLMSVYVGGDRVAIFKSETK